MKNFVEYCINKFGEYECQKFIIIIYILLWVIIVSLPYLVNYLEKRYNITKKAIPIIRLIEAIIISSIIVIVIFSLEAMFLRHY